MRILLVDDEPAILNLLEQFLKRAGHECVTAARADEAKSRIASLDALDAAVVDMLLPDGNGEDVGRAILASHPRVKLVFASGMAQPVSADLADRGARLLSKPFMPRALLNILANGD